MLDYTISRPTEDDCDGLIAMHAQSWIDAYPSDKHGVSLDYIENYIQRFSDLDGRRRRLDYIRESYENPNYYFKIAKDKLGKVVGFVDARRGEKLELNGLYIAKSAYGSGLAKALAAPALEWLGKEKDISVTVVKHNQRARKFYSKLGFEAVPGSDKLHNNTPLTVIEMIRKGDAK